MSDVVEEPPQRVPPGTRVVVYACLSPEADPTTAPEQGPRGVLRYAHERGWIPVATFVDRAAVLSSRADRPEWPKALAAVVEGRTEGIVSPSMVMLWFHQEDRDSLANWLNATRAFVSTPGTHTDPRRCRAVGSPPVQTAAAPPLATGSKRRR
ncbi:recombinase family protein [Streptomyces pacificus]|uniref:Resolvase/invertase-type recombinase catalytic domain-containing protein n=1 Tax=Streptomyces pacificus TaxID=2705029 RepID=A0A6A0B2C8_9ACTN|nr:recombinase family protein [Streptomyces pacificus]GFH39469.1 hypothetical protein SCWH03_57370 [Streptomyces pacificus]